MLSLSMDRLLEALKQSYLEGNSGSFDFMKQTVDRIMLEVEPKKFDVSKIFHAPPPNNNYLNLICLNCKSKNIINRQQRKNDGRVFSLLICERCEWKMPVSDYINFMHRNI